VSNSWSTTLLTSIITHEYESESGIITSQIEISGNRTQGHIVAAVRHAYPNIQDVTETLAALDGQKVTILQESANTFGASMLTAWEGTLFKDGQALLPKGKRTKGYRVDVSRVLDIVPGYRVGVFRHNVDAVRARYPEIRELTRERLESLPNRGSNCTLGVFGSMELQGANRCYDAVWLIHSYISGDDIAEGVLYVRKDAGYSEHGSIYGTQLEQMGGEIIGDISISLQDSLDMIDLDHDDMLRKVMESRHIVNA